MYHTPEPWLYDEERAAVAYDGRAYAIEGHRIGCIIAEPRLRTDGRRIAACVNACAGIADPADLRRQRDELLAILSRLTEKVERANSIQHSGGEILEEDWAELYQLANESRAAIAIANAEPQPKE